MKLAIPEWTPATIFSTDWAGPLRPKNEAVAKAPSTTSMRMMKMKKRMRAVEQAKKAQKILRAKASRKVSRTRASDAMLLFAPIRCLRGLSGFDGFHKH